MLYGKVGLQLVDIRELSFSAHVRKENNLETMNTTEQDFNFSNYSPTSLGPVLHAYKGFKCKG